MTAVGKYIRTLEIREKNRKGSLSNLTFFWKGKHLPEEVKKKISETSKGKVISAIHRNKISQSLKGRKPWNTGKKLSIEHRKKLSDIRKGRIPHNKGIKGVFHHTKKHREYMSRVMSGSQSPFWKGGLTEENKKIRSSMKMRDWRKAVFARDNYTCQFTGCGIRGYKGFGKRVILNADHIKPFSLFPHLRFEVSNGRTLCLECHKKTETWGRNVNKK